MRDYSSPILRVKAGVPKTLDAGDNPTFDRWLERVDAMVQRTTGLYLDDLPDCAYRSWYESRMRPVWAAKKALKNAGGEV